MIQEVLEKNEIKYEFYETNGRMDACNFVMNMDLENCAAIVLVGGDGTMHEGVNGMMRREDGKRVPMGMLPNGSGDDTAGGLGIEYNDIDRALSYIVKGHVIKTDVIEILIDHENKEAIQ